MNTALAQNTPKRNVTLPTLRSLFPESPLFRQRGIGQRHIYHTLTKNLKEKYSETLIVNLSNHNLSKQETEVLSRGLTFIPTPKKSPSSDRSDSINGFINTMKRQYHFHNPDDESTTKTRHPFWMPSGWVPPDPTNIALQNFFTKIKEAPNQQTRHPGCDNLTPAQTEALKSLTNNKNITIKSADKGGGICVMDTTEYISKIMDHLNDTNTYKKLDHNPLTNIHREISDYLEFLVTVGRIDETTKRFLTPPSPPRLPPFYGIPKIHKTDNPLRPIVSGCDSVTDNLSRYVTHFLQPLAEMLPSHIKDTTHFLQELQKLPPLPDNTFLVTADVSSLYTNIPHEEGINAALHYITTHRKNLPKYTPPNQVFRNMLRLILGNSIFEFMDEIFHQISGTSMGTRMAPPYANLFMGLLEQAIQAKFGTLFSFWKRFIDDIFFLFQGTEIELKEMFTHMNSTHPTIKFTFEYSKSCIPFLDTVVYVDNNRQLQTTIHRKPTDRTCLLHYSSHHPEHVKQSIIYTQALRYCTIISDDRNLETELHTLCRVFLARGYPLRVICQQFQKALTFPRHTLIQPKPKTTTQKEVTPIVAPYNPQGVNASRIIHDSWQMIEEDQHLKEIWPKHPVTAYKRSRNLKDTLVHSKQPKI